MKKELMFSQRVLRFNDNLSKISLKLPNGFKIINPFKGESGEVTKKITAAFYSKFYNDTNKRYMVLGSSPARRGTAVTGVPYEDAQHLQAETGILIDDFRVNKSSSNFLYEVIEEYGGCKKFYNDFYMNFVCPLGIARINSKRNAVNCNYYENKRIKDILYPFIINSIKEQLNFNIDTSICYCIGSGENYKFLSRLNKQYHFFQSIIPLEHPRFIMQYNSNRKDFFIEKYLSALKNSCGKERLEV